MDSATSPSMHPVDQSPNGARVVIQDAVFLWDDSEAGDNNEQLGE
jgi:hypothetical protein